MTLWFFKNKTEILVQYIVSFENPFDFVNIENLDCFQYLSKIIANGKIIEIESFQFMLNENELLEMTRDEELKKFIKEALSFNFND